MKLFLYSDVHISKTSSILPLTSSKEGYTYRQDMIIKTAQWMHDIIMQNNIDMIINLGDTFDQNTLTSYDIVTASTFFYQMPSNKPHIVLCGNHEMLNRSFNSIKLFDNIDGVQVIDTPTEIDGLLFIPYCDSKDLNLNNYNGSDYLFLHHDIYGSQIAPGRVLDFGISQSDLSKFKKVFNGHVHAASKFANIINVGSVTTHSFADSSESYPRCYIFDTVTQELQEFKNYNCPLFRKLKIETLDELRYWITNGGYDTQWTTVLNVECPFEIKEQVDEYLSNAKSVISYRVMTKSVKQEGEQKEVSNIESNLDVKKSFKDFLNSGIELRYPVSLYNEMLEEQKEIIEDKFETVSSNNSNILF